MTRDAVILAVILTSAVALAGAGVAVIAGLKAWPIVAAMSLASLGGAGALAKFVDGERP